MQGPHYYYYYYDAQWRLIYFGHVYRSSSTQDDNRVFAAALKKPSSAWKRSRMRQITNDLTMGSRHGFETAEKELWFTQNISAQNYGQGNVEKSCQHSYAPQSLSTMMISYVF